MGIAGAGGGGNGGAGGTSIACVAQAQIQRRLLALQPVQYANATRDLLALTAAPPVPDVFTYGARGAALFPVDGPYLFGLYQSARSIATTLAPRAAALAACASGETAVDCAARFARSFGRKAFRRSLEDVEVTDLLKVFAAVCPGPSTSCASPDDFAAAITLMVKAFVLAPSFLYRTELGPRGLAAGIYPDTALTADEVAAQLGFTLLGSTPDAALIAAADSGALATQAGILAQVSRLLAMPAAQDRVTGLVGEWLHIDRLPQRIKDPSFLSPLTGADLDQAVLAGDLRASWDRAVTETLWSSPPGKITNLLTSQRFYANRRLATLYGLSSAGLTDGALAELAWPAAQPRAGILTHPAFLWAISPPSNDSPVQRGQAIHDDIVCQDLVAPDPGGTSPEFQAVIRMGDSEATRSDARLAAGKLCADSCHSELDPYGRLLHAFDTVGKFRTVDEVGRPVDTSVNLTARSPLGARTVSGPLDLANALVSTKVFAGCAVQRMFEAMLAAPVYARDTCQVNALRAAFDRSDGTMGALLGEILTSELARARAGGAP